jgi:glutamate 5-kinase
MLLSGEARGTLVHAQGSPASAYKAWIAGTLAPAGTYRIDFGAVAALERGSSLLPPGVTSIEGKFGRGDCVRVIGPENREVARGVSRYDAGKPPNCWGRRVRTSPSAWATAAGMNSSTATTWCCDDA